MTSVTQSIRTEHERRPLWPGFGLAICLLLLTSDIYGQAPRSQDPRSVVQEAQPADGSKRGPVPCVSRPDDGLGSDGSRCPNALGAPLPVTRTGSAQVPKKRSFLRRQWEQVLGTKASAHEVGLLVFPTVAYAPETLWEFGLDALNVYYAADNPKNRLSELSAFVFITQERQYGLLLEHTLYSDKNEWLFYGQIRGQSFPMKFYGVGDEATSEDKAYIDGEFILIRERALKRVVGSLYLGLQLDVQHIQEVHYRPTEGHEDHPQPYGTAGGTNIGVGLGVVYDNCHNAMNVRDGYLGEVGFLHYPETISTYPMTSYFFDSRLFHSTTKTQVIALQAQGNFTFGEVPFNQMASLGGAGIMRGYYAGRYRDRFALATQIEYRWLPFFEGWRVGGAMFAALGTVSDTLSFKRVLWTAGFGPRVLLFPQKDIYVRFDIAYTEEGKGYYFFIGEAF